MRRRRVPGETSAAGDVVVVVDVVDADASDASERADDGGSLICARALRAASEMDAARCRECALRAAPQVRAAVCALRAAPLRLILASAARVCALAALREAKRWDTTCPETTRIRTSMPRNGLAGARGL